MITAGQLVAHAIGDYVLQSDWMATEKTKRSAAALIHAIFYSIPFLFFRPTVWALAVIVVTHFIIDRWRLARYVVWAKNFLAPRHTLGATTNGGLVKIETVCWWRPWSECKNSFGYPPERPAFMAIWLMIICDNIIHVLLNALALAYL